MATGKGPCTPLSMWFVEIFALGNLGFLALDIYMAHSINRFAHAAEWIPVYFSLIAPLVLLPGVLTRQHREGVRRHAGLWIGSASMLVGVLGKFVAENNHLCL